MKRIEKVLITGGGGYVGSVLVEKILKAGYEVRVLDIFWFGEDALERVRNHPSLCITVALYY